MKQKQHDRHYYTVLFMNFSCVDKKNTVLQVGLECTYFGQIMFIERIENKSTEVYNILE